MSHCRFCGPDVPHPDLNHPFAHCAGGSGAVCHGIFVEWAEGRRSTDRQGTREIARHWECLICGEQWQTGSVAAAGSMA